MTRQKSGAVSVNPEGLGVEEIALLPEDLFTQLQELLARDDYQAARELLQLRRKEQD